MKDAADWFISGSGAGLGAVPAADQSEAWPLFCWLFQSLLFG